MRTNRPFSQDFSGNSMTDQSFGPACDVNRIVRHYQETGVDPYIDRLKNQRFGVATSRSYEEAMRQKAELDSAFALLPSSEREKHDNDAQKWFHDTTTPEAVTEPLTPSQDAPVDPPPEDSIGGDQGE